MEMPGTNEPQMGGTSKQRVSRRSRAKSKTNEAGQSQPPLADHAAPLQQNRATEGMETRPSSPNAIRVTNTYNAADGLRRQPPKPPGARGNTLRTKPAVMPAGTPSPMTVEDARAEIDAESAFELAKGLIETGEITTFEELLDFLIEEARAREGVHLSEEHGVLHLRINVSKQVPLKHLVRPKVITALATLGAVIGFGLDDVVQQPGRVIEFIRMITNH